MVFDYSRPVRDGGGVALKRRLIALLTLAIALAALPAAALGDASRRAANSTTFDDSAGEDPAAPDITQVVVSNTDAGLITFQINVSNRPAFTPDMFFDLYLDTDENAETGNALLSGADYVIELVPGAVNLFRWNGADFVAARSQTSLIYSYAATGPTIRISAADLGRTKKLAVKFAASSGFTSDASGNPEFANLHTDLAPDAGHGTYSYQVLTKLLLKVTAFMTTPKPARAGRTFSASLAANRNDTAGPVEKGTVACDATIALKRIAPVKRALANGVASCIWRIPPSAKGKVLRGRITLTVEGVQVSRGFSSRVG